MRKPPGRLLGLITIPADDELTIGSPVETPIELRTLSRKVQGTLTAGSERYHIESPFTMTLYGKENAIDMDGGSLLYLHGKVAVQTVNV